MCDMMFLVARTQQIGGDSLSEILTTIGYPKFKQYMKENNIQQSELAELLGYSREKVNTILNGTNRYGSDFTGKDFIKIHKKYNVNINKYFFDYKVALKQQNFRSL